MDVFYEQTQTLYEFSTRSGIAVAVLSALVLIGTAYQAIRLKQYSPHLLAAIAAICNLISGAIAGSDLAGKTEAQILAGAIADVFFSAVFVALIWLIVFEMLRLARPQHAESATHRKCFHSDLLGVYAAYLWTFILIVCDVGVAGTLAAFYGDPYSMSYTGLVNVIQTYQFGFFGCWAYVAWLGWQLSLSWSNVASFIRPFVVYIVLAILVTIGRSIPAAPSAGSPMSIVVAEFVLARIFGLVGLAYVSYFCPKWCGTQVDEVAPLSQPNNPGLVPAQSQSANSLGAEKTEVSQDVV